VEFACLKLSLASICRRSEKRGTAERFKRQFGVLRGLKRSIKRKMKAVAKTKREPGIEVVEIDQDGVEDDLILLKMKSASICGSDLGFYDFTLAYQKFAKVPVVMGHEFAGEIAQLGRNVSGFSEGDRVVSESVIYCGACKFCRAGMTNICQNFTVFGMHRNGGFAEYVTMNPKFLHKLPDEVSFLEGGIVEPLSVVVNALDDVSEVNLANTAAIIGPGPLGLFSAEVLRSKGASDIVVIGIGIDSFRLGIAGKKLGYKTLNSEEQNPQEEIVRMTGGYGCDIVVVATGAPPALRSAISLVSKGGQIVILGIFPEDVPIPASDLVRRQVSFKGSYASSWKHYEQAISLLKQKKVRAEDIVSHRFPLDQATEAFQMAKAKTGSKVQFKT
jgi:L-iditol 2-dehydrogenase